VKVGGVHVYLEFFKDLSECSLLVCGFPPSTGDIEFRGLMWLSLLWFCICTGEVYVYWWCVLYSVEMWNYIGVTNACSSVVLYIYIYTACDIFYYWLYYYAWPTLHDRQPPGFTLSLWASPFHRQSSYLSCLYVCLCGANIYAGTLV